MLLGHERHTVRLVGPARAKKLFPLAGTEFTAPDIPDIHTDVAQDQRMLQMPTENKWMHATVSASWWPVMQNMATSVGSSSRAV